MDFQRHAGGSWLPCLLVDAEGTPMDDRATVYVALLDEGIAVWRPVANEFVAPNLFRLLGPVPRHESWQFQPGEVVRCEARVLSGGRVLVAVERSSVG